MRAAVDAVEVDVLHQALYEVLGQGHRGFQPGLEGVFAFFAHERVGVVAVGQEQEFQLPSVACLRQGIFQRAPCGCAAGAVAVEAEHHFVANPEQAIEVVGGGAGAKGSHCVVDAGLRQSHHVHVTLDHHEPCHLAQGLARFVKTVKLAAFVEERGFRAVEVFRLALVDDATTETDDATARIADGEHDTVTEAVVVAGAACVLRIAFNQHARGHQGLAPRRSGAEGIQHIVPAVACVAQCETVNRFAGQAALLEVGARTLVFAERRPVMLGDVHHQRVEVVVAAVFGASLRAFTRNFQTRTPGEFFHGLNEAEVVVFHEEADGGAMRAATEAVIELLYGVHVKRRGFFVVEGAAALRFAPAAFQCDARTHHFDNVDAGEELVNEMLGNASGHGRSIGQDRGSGESAAWRARMNRPANQFRPGLAAEARLDEGADGTHIRAASSLRLHLRHDLAHVLDGRGTGGGNGFVDDGSEFIRAQLRRQVAGEPVDFP